MSDKLRIAIIGNGGICQVHLAGYRNMPNIEIVALCDCVLSKAEQTRANLGKDVPIFEDYHDVLKLDYVDAVDVDVPNYLHAPISIAALKAGKHVFCEKPDCITVEDAQAMEAAAKESGKVLMVMRNNRHYDASRFVKKMINDGEFGEVYAARCGWVRRRGVPGKGGWFTTKEQSGGGPLIDLGVHMMDLTIWLMGNPRPVAVSGATFRKFADNSAQADSENSSFGEAVEDGVFDVEDNVMGFVRFDNGTCMQFEFTWASNIEEEHRFVELRGEKAGCSIVDGQTLKIYGETADGKLYDYMPKFAAPPMDISGHQRNLEHFVDVVLNGAKPDFEAQQGINMIKIINAIYKSAETGKEVTL